MLAEKVAELESENRRLKAALEDFKVKVKETPDKPRACNHCRFYLKHYIKREGIYRETNCGHCIHGQFKSRKPSDTCKYFE